MPTGWTRQSRRRGQNWPISTRKRCSSPIHGNALYDYFVQTYLDWDPSSYPVLKTMRQNIDMYSTLWHTALDFHENYEKWYSGPVSQLDADSIRVKVEQAKYQISYSLCVSRWTRCTETRPA